MYLLHLLLSESWVFVWNFSRALQLNDSQNDSSSTKTEFFLCKVHQHYSIRQCKDLTVLAVDLFTELALPCVDVQMRFSLWLASYIRQSRLQCLGRIIMVADLLTFSFGIHPLYLSVSCLFYNTASAGVSDTKPYCSSP